MEHKPVQSYKDLLVWQRAMRLVQEVYLLTRRFPASEAFGLTSQLRRAVTSIPSNIAEGNARRGRDYIRLLLIARASHQEVETQLLIAKALDYVSSEHADRAVDLNCEVGRMLSALIDALERHVRAKSK